jgi:hypothetical protein
MSSQERYRRIESMIKNLSSTQIEELFKIFQRNKCQYTINNNGIFLNLSWVSNDILTEIERFITFCLESKEQLDQYEAIYQNLNKNFREPVLLDELEEKELIIPPEEIAVIISEQKKIPSRISSSMKYYLFKKKFSKNMNPSVGVQYIKDGLIKEEPIF